MSKYNMMTLPAAYELLGLDMRVKLSPEILSKAYRKAALTNHPDTKFGELAKREAAEKMASINDAKELLEKLVNRAPGFSANPFGTAKPVDEHVLESKFQEEVIAAWESVGALILKVHGNAFQKAGWPDLQVYHPKWTGHLELKVGDNKPSAIQEIVIRDLMARKTWAYVMRFRTGVVYLETEKGMVLASLEGWKKMTTHQRAQKLLEMLGAQR
jgi:hypothetical protein